MELKAGQIVTVAGAQPSATNGCKKVSYLLPQNLTCVAKTRIATATDSCITPEELQQLRQLVVLAIGGLN